jgi:hypothetical protein
MFLEICEFIGSSPLFARNRSTAGGRLLQKKMLVQDLCQLCGSEREAKPNTRLERATEGN